jgi:uncharacterized protein (TIGR02246 family)
VAEQESAAVANAMIAGWVDSWNRSDGLAYGDGYWDDAELVDPSGRMWSGRAAIEQRHVDLWAGVFKGRRMTAAARRIQMLGPDFLLVDMDAELTDAPALPSGGHAHRGGMIQAHLKHILAKREGTWRILFAQNTIAFPESAVHAVNRTHLRSLVQPAAPVSCGALLAPKS